MFAVCATRRATLGLVDCLFDFGSIMVFDHPDMGRGGSGKFPLKRGRPRGADACGGFVGLEGRAVGSINSRDGIGVTADGQVEFWGDRRFGGRRSLA